MALGNIFEAKEGPRGRDLNARVQVPRSALGRPFSVTVPLELPVGALRVRRATGQESGDQVTLNLHADFPDGARVRLTGLGEPHPDGHPGDLYLDIELVDVEPTPDHRWIAACVLLAVGLAAWTLLR